MKKRDIFTEIVDELLAVDKSVQPIEKEKQREINREKQLETVALGEAAMELENFKPFQEVLLPYTKDTLTACIAKLIIDGIKMSKEEINVYVTKMQGSMEIYAVIKKLRDDAKEANKYLGKEKTSKEEHAKKLQEIEDKHKKRLEAIEKKESEVKKK